MIEHPEYGEVIQLQGDQRKNICQFLLEVSGWMHPVCDLERDRNPFLLSEKHRTEVVNRIVSPD